MNIQVIINNRYNHRKIVHIEKVIRKKLEQHNLTISRTEFKGHATILARDAVRNEKDTIIAVGGDGTVNEIANVIAGSQILLGIIPQGTANDFALHLRIPTDIESACDLIVQKDFRLIDTISVNNQICLTSCGIGVPERAAFCSDKIRDIKGIGSLLRKLLQSKLYILGLITSIIKFRLHKFTVSLSIENKVVLSKLYSIVISNQQFIGKHFHVFPNAECDDGSFNVFLINNNFGRFGVLKSLFRTLNGTHVNQKNVQLFSEKKLSLFFYNSINLLIDGEINTVSKHITIKILPKSISVITPT